MRPAWLDNMIQKPSFFAASEGRFSTVWDRVGEWCDNTADAASSVCFTSGGGYPSVGACEASEAALRDPRCAYAVNASTPRSR
jgi:hypothetical protein